MSKSGSRAGGTAALIASTCLVILVFQNTLFFYATHEGRVPDKDGQVYFAPTMVVYVEALKSLISFVILFISLHKAQPAGTLPLNSSSPASASASPSTNESQQSLMQSYREEEGRQVVIDLDQKSETMKENRQEPSVERTLNAVWALLYSRTAWKLSIPATLYVLQTNLAVVGAQNLDSTSFVIASQLKFATTALCTSIMLKRYISPRQWASLIVLSIGVLLVQLAGQSQPLPAAASASNAAAAAVKARSTILGLFCITVACFISGFASIFMEKILKNGTSNLWATNIQLGAFGVIPAILPVFLDIYRNGWAHPFGHFGFWAWMTVEANVMGGLVVALIMKYSDNIQKNMSISVSIVVTFLLMVYVGKAELDALAIFGSTLVIGAIIYYNKLGAGPAKSAAPSKPAVVSESHMSQISIEK